MYAEKYPVSGRAAPGRTFVALELSRKIARLSERRRALSALRQGPVTVAALLAILVLALGLRFYGLSWDQGFSYTPHPDERAILAKVAEISPPALGNLGVLFDADDSPWNPRWFPYGSLPLYLLKGVELISGLGPGDGISDLRLAGRTISTLADVATVALVFLLGRAIYGRRVGILAALFTALAVIHIQLSHFFAVDTLLALFTAAALYFAFRVAKTGRFRDSLLAGLFVGLGLGTKVSQAPLFGALVVAHLMFALSLSGATGSVPAAFEKRGPVALKGLAVAVIAAFGVLFLVQPYTFLDWSRFYGDVVEQSEMVRRIRDYPYTRQYIDTTPYLYQVRQLATWGLGWPLGAVAWAGLLYASLRGMAWRHRALYLMSGWAIPGAILVWSSGFPAIFLASGIALGALLGTLPVRRPDSRADVLLLSWVVPYLLITGAFQVKFLRYLIPVTPFLLLFGSRMLFALWDRACLVEARRIMRPVIAAGIALLVTATAFYALSYLGVYRQPHTAVRASEWINRNAPKGSVILKEHWEEGLPNLRGHSVRELPLYDADGARKTRLLADELAAADYLVFFSNRLYGTIPRLPERYPVSREYYRLLFTGQLGYRLVNVEATYPKLFDVRFIDETYARPDLPDPASAALGDSFGALDLSLGHADESFSVYDHPKVLVFENAGGLSAETLSRTISSAAPVFQGRSATEKRPLGLMMSPSLAEAQQRGGTWGDIVSTGRWTNRLPILAWLVVVEGIALLVLPLTMVIFRLLPDRGFLFSKALGLLSVGLIVWLLASLRWMAFSQGSIAVGASVVALGSLLVLARNRDEIVAFIRARWRVLLIGEAVFLLAFFAFLAIRMANPDLWHPFRGGEKPMDLAYLNAVVRSSYMPPYDPWFAGGYLNYYYWGQFIVATLVRATGIDPTVAFNLAVPLFFALTAAGSYAIVYNLAESTRRVKPAREGSGRWGWSPVAAGLGAVLFVTVLGNLDGAIQVGQGVWNALFVNAPFGEFEFWQSSRMMAPDPPGHEITEFPFFTFLFADLHAHMMALPFTLLALGLGLTVILGGRSRGKETARWSGAEVMTLVALGVTVGSLRLLNAWDLPTYLAIAVAAVFAAEVFANGGVSLVALARAGVKALIVFAAGFVAFLPFDLAYEAFFNWVEPTTNTTVLWQFLAISGLFVFILGSFFIGESVDWLRAAGRHASLGAGRLLQAVSEPDDASRAARAIAILLAGAAIGGAIFAGVKITPVVADSAGSTVPFVAVLALLVAVAGARWLLGARADGPQLTFVALIVGVALALVMGLDVLRVEGDIDRMNSVFKFYLQVWVLLALASAYALWRLAEGRRVAMIRLPARKKVWVGALVALLASAAVYPVLGTHDRLRDRFDGETAGVTLDGVAYAVEAVYRDAKGKIALAPDLAGVDWLKRNVSGSPIVLEGVTPTYQWGGRVSVYSGMPSVVGWQWHQQQQRWGYRGAVTDRIADVNRLYGTTSPSEALALIQKYGVRYIYVGQVERLYYDEAGLRKFDGALAGALERVFATDHVTIYRVRDDAL